MQVSNETLFFSNEIIFSVTRQYYLVMGWSYLVTRDYSSVIGYSSLVF